jgi:putative oxidoreductase
MTNWTALVGRVLLSAIFINSGINKAMAPAATIAGFTKLGLILPPLAYAIAVAVELGGGLAVLVGWKTRWASLILAVFCVAAAFLAHYHPGDRGQMIHFMKNIAIAGGFLQLMAFGPGRLSLSRR